MNKLTRRQQQVLDLIRAHQEQHGAPPTRAELAQLLGLRAPSTVDQHLQALAAKGQLDLRRGLNRNIRLGPDHDGGPRGGLPLVGRVAAGAPILAEQHIENRYRLDSALFDPRPDYLLRVRGMSMRDAGIFDGDLLAVCASTDLDIAKLGGQVVVARVDDEVTVKRLEKPAGRRQVLRLLPENPDFAPIVIDLTRQELTIEGVAVGVIRHGRF